MLGYAPNALVGVGGVYGGLTDLHGLLEVGAGAGQVARAVTFRLRGSGIRVR